MRLDVAQWRLVGREAMTRFGVRYVVRNPVMFVVWVGTWVTLALAVARAAGGEPWGYALALAVTLWVTVLFANVAEAVAEARGKAQAASLREARAETTARRVGEDGGEEQVSSAALRRGDRVRVAAGELIPADGEVVAGLASVDESAITGESAPVLREAGTDRSGVTGGTRVLSDEVTVEVSVNPGDSFLDRMIEMVEGASRQQTPNEQALTTLLVALTLVFVIVVGVLPVQAGFLGVRLDWATLIALLVCLIPTTIGGLLPAIGIAGMDRAMRANVIAKSGKAVEVAGDIDTLLIDKTGTVTFGNRRATRWVSAPGVQEATLRQAAALASWADVTPEGRSIVGLARAAGDVIEGAPEGATFIEFSAHTRMSGVDLPGGRSLRKGAVDQMMRWVEGKGGAPSPELQAAADQIAAQGATPLVVVDGARPLGVVALSDVVKPNIRERFQRLRALGIRTVMVTGDNPLTAAAIAAEAGVDSFIAEAKPEDKLDAIRAEQAAGKLVAMMGDGTNDAPALAQADVGLAMNAGTQAAREAGNMIDLDSDPTKLLDVVEIGKQLLITRGALTTFSVANDVAKYFAILPALFLVAFPGLGALDLMGLSSPQSAVLSATVFNALIIPALIPLALRGVSYRPSSADALLARNLLLFGLGGLIVPFIGIKLIDLIISPML
jgi:potassium-transporting ATPase ATP-binding subunit